jgi:DNA-binding transcriptional regulator YiaG
MSPAEFAAIEAALGITDGALARALGCSGDRTVRRWRNGERAIPGTVATLMRLLFCSPAARDQLGLPAVLRRAP